MGRLKESVRARIKEIKKEFEMEESKQGQVEEASHKEVTHSVDMAASQKLEDRESKPISSEDCDEANQSDKPVSDHYGPVTPPNIPPRSRMRRQQKCQDESTIAQPLSHFSSSHGPESSLTSPSPGASSQTPSATDFAQPKQTILEAELHQFLDPFTKEWTKCCPATALRTKCLEIIDSAVSETNEGVQSTHFSVRLSAQMFPPLLSFSQSTPSNLQPELHRLRKDLEHRERRSRELEKLVAEQEDVIRKSDRTFADQVLLLDQQYDRMGEKDERIRRLEADVVLLKNAAEKSERALQKELLRSQAPVHIFVPTGAGTSAASMASNSFARSTRRPLSAPTGSLHSPASTSNQTPGTSDRSFLGMPLFGMYISIPYIPS